MDFMNPKEVVEHWGPEFKKIATNPRVKFDQSFIYVELSRPIPTDEGDEVSILKIKEPMTEELMATDSGDGDVAKAAHLLRACAGIPFASVKKIRGRDFVLVQSVIGVFLADGQ